MNASQDLAVSFLPELLSFLIPILSNDVKYLYPIHKNIAFKQIQNTTFINQITQAHY